MYARTLLKDGKVLDFEIDVEYSERTTVTERLAKQAIKDITGVPPGQQSTVFLAASTGLQNITKLSLPSNDQLTPATTRQSARLREEYPEIFQQSLIFVHRIGYWDPGDPDLPENRVRITEEIADAGDFLRALYGELNSPRTVDAAMLDQFPSFRDGIREDGQLRGFLTEALADASGSSQVTRVELTCYDDIFRSIAGRARTVESCQFDSSAAHSLFFGSVMMLPPFTWERHLFPSLIMTADRSSGLRLFISRNGQPNVCAYTPKSDLLVIDRSSGLPTLICEVDSRVQRRDRTRMILQGVVACRQWRFVLPESHKDENVLLGIFVHESFAIDLCFFHADESYNVEIFQEPLFLRQRNSALRLARILFNYRRNVLNVGDRCDQNKIEVLQRLVSESNSLPSFTSCKEPSTRKSHRSSKQPGLSTIVESSTAALLFSAEVQSLLCPDGACVQGTKHENVAVVKMVEAPFKTLGFIKLTNRPELDAFDIIRESGSDFLLNHIVLPTKVVEVSGYRVMFLPFGGVPLLHSWGLPDAPFGHEVQIAWDLLTIVSQLHDLHIAHLDIKPTNILWDSSSESIRVIDFDSAAILKSNGRREIKGIFGTSGYCAPEAESGEGLDYDPFLADAFSCGEVLWEMIHAESMSEERRFVLDLSTGLRNRDVKERWSISRARGAWIDWLKKYRDNYPNSIHADRVMTDSSRWASVMPPASAICVH